MAMLCCRACGSQPCILLVTARSFCRVVVRNWIGFRREADRSLRRSRFAAWIIDRLPALLSHAVENPRPLEPAFTRSAREAKQGRGAETQSNPKSEGWIMEKAFQAKVQVFAGIDVSARELRVAVQGGVEAGIAVTTF